MDSRKKAIEKHLKKAGIPSKLIEQSLYFAIECSKTCTRLTKICAAVGLYLAASQQNHPYGIKQISSMFDVKCRKILKFSSSMKNKPYKDCLKKIPKLEEMLEKCQAEPIIREKAYNFIENKICKTPFQALNAAYSNHGGFLLAQQQKNLLTAKHNKNENLEKSIVRLENLINGTTFDYESLPCLSLLDIEKDIMSKALGITFHQYI